jgi:hypothetical protein
LGVNVALISLVGRYQNPSFFGVLVVDLGILCAMDSPGSEAPRVFL